MAVRNVESELHAPHHVASVEGERRDIILANISLAGPLVSAYSDITRSLGVVDTRDPLPFDGIDVRGLYDGNVPVYLIGPKRTMDSLSVVQTFPGGRYEATVRLPNQGKAEVCWVEWSYQLTNVVQLFDSTKRKDGTWWSASHPVDEWQLHFEPGAPRDLRLINFLERVKAKEVYVFICSGIQLRDRLAPVQCLHVTPSRE